jgi:hypothetical protein
MTSVFIVLKYLEGTVQQERSQEVKKKPPVYGYLGEAK